MIRWIFTFFLIPTAILAEPITIRSGEHATFSRLVLSIGIGTEWQVTPTDGGYLLDLSGSLDGYETGNVFERIPRARIADISQRTKNKLFLEVDCVCHADVFLWRPGRLVLDIVDGKSPNAPTIETPIAQAISEWPTDAPLRLPNLLMFANARSEPPSLTIPKELQNTPRSSDIQAAETVLIEGFARAVSQGFLDPAISFRIAPTTGIETEVSEKSNRDLPGPVPTPGRPGVGISTAFDREFVLLGDVLSEVTGQQCLPNDLFEIETWADERDFHEQVAALAEGLAGEFGAEPIEAQDKLARLYLHFGFGAEARSIMTVDTALSQSRQIILELAGIVDEYPGPYHLIAAQAGCATLGGLWAFYENPIALDDEGRNQILQQFFALPQPLRGQIAPRLSRKFVELGDLDAGTKVLRAAENYDVAAIHDVQAMRALIAEEMNDPDAAIAVLSREADDNARTTPESLIRFIELAIEQGQVPKEADLVLSAAMRQEYRNMPVAADLAVAEARGWIQKGQYHSALTLVMGREDSKALAVINSAFAHLTRHATPTVFLEFGFYEIPNGATDQTENDMARRMIDLGFPERASVLLSASAEGEAASERRFLRAEAFLATANYAAVFDELSETTDLRARDLRAMAYSGLGEYREALAASDPNQSRTNGATLQFRAGAWERLTVQDDQVLSTFAQAVLTPSVTGMSETLATRRAILTQSQESRRAVEELLLRFDGTAPEE